YSVFVPPLNIYRYLVKYVNISLSNSALIYIIQTFKNTNNHSRTRKEFLMNQNQIDGLLIVLALINFACLLLFDHFIIYNIFTPLISIGMIVLIVMYFVKGKREKNKNKA